MENDKLGVLLNSRLDLNMKVKHQPWYRERIDTKYSKNTFTDTTSWTFIKNGLDDYRDGKPPELHDDELLILKRTNHIKPNVIGSSQSSLSSEANPRVKKTIDKYDTIYSRSIPNRRKKIEQVMAIEKDILNRPVPCNETDLPHSVSHNVNRILNPSGIHKQTCTSSTHNNTSVNNNNTSVTDQTKEDTPENTSVESPENSEESVTETAEFVHSDDTALIDMYTNRALEHQKLAKHPSKSCLVLPEEDSVDYQHQGPKKLEQIECVTKDFCDWVESIGGDKNNIGEETIKELFVCAYEGDTSLSTVQTLNLSKVPSELLADAYLSRETGIKRHLASQKGCKGGKVQYGAWYLDPNTWATRSQKEIQAKSSDENSKHLKSEFDDVLPLLHSAQAFRNFTEERNYSRKPEFLGQVAVADGNIETNNN